MDFVSLFPEIHKLHFSYTKQNQFGRKKMIFLEQKGVCDLCAGFQARKKLFESNHPAPKLVM
jgi:hypothetical protein